MFSGTTRWRPLRPGETGRPGVRPDAVGTGPPVRSPGPPRWRHPRGRRRRRRQQVADSRPVPHVEDVDVDHGPAPSPLDHMGPGPARPHGQRPEVVDGEVRGDTGRSGREPGKDGPPGDHVGHGGHQPSLEPAPRIGDPGVQVQLDGQVAVVIGNVPEPQFLDEVVAGRDDGVVLRPGAQTCGPRRRPPRSLPNGDGLGLEVLLEALDAVLATDAAGLVAAEGGRRRCSRRRR